MKLLAKHVLAAATAALLASCGGGADDGESLTLEQKAGQLVMMGVDGTTPDAPGVREALAQVRAGELGGVILYRPSARSPAIRQWWFAMRRDSFRRTVKPA